MGAEEVRPPGGQGLGDDDGVTSGPFPLGQRTELAALARLPQLKAV